MFSSKKQEQLSLPAVIYLFSNLSITSSLLIFNTSAISMIV